MYSRMKYCPRSWPLLSGLVLYSAMPSRIAIAHSPHTQYKRRYRAESPGAGLTVAHAKTAVTKSAREIESTNNTLFGLLLRPQASQPETSPGEPLVLVAMRPMLAGVSERTRESSSRPARDRGVAPEG